MERLNRFLTSDPVPILFGALTALEIALVWGSLWALPTVHDEAAYLLQARIFARGHWTAPAPALPEFFEQYHVLVTPVLAGKYPPGHSLFLVPGVWLGVPGLMPVVLAGLAGGFVFLLARRVANSWVALLTWLVWTTSTGNLRFLPTYLSQDTTVLLWLAGWWALLEWRRGKGAAWLVALSVFVALGIATRPFTGLAFAAAAAFVVGRDVYRRRAWRELALAAVPAVAVAGLIALWSVRTTGSVWTTPYTLYSRIYFPYQRFGFGLPASTASRRPLPPDMARYGEWFLGLHAAHTIEAVPRDLRDRLRGIASDTWGERSWPLGIFALAGLVALPAEGAFALATGALLLLFYIPFAHPWPWSVYYLEAQPPLAFVTALGIWAVVCWIVVRPRPRPRELVRTAFPRAALTCAVLALALLAPAFARVVKARRTHRADAADFRAFRSVLDSIPDRRAIVFVRYRPDHFPHHSLIDNDPDLAASKIWVVYDRGAEDERLRKAAPDRAAYVFDEASGRLTPLPASRGS
jgi:hypothetical protein